MINMRCSGCGSDQFNIDDASGRYVCIACWQVSDYFEGLAQDFATDSAATTGLRVIHTATVASQRDLFGLQSHTSALSGNPSQLFDGFTPANHLPATIKEEPLDCVNQDEFVDKKPCKFKEEENHIGTSPTYNQKIFGKVRRDRTKLRRWRMSEPVALILRYQLAEVIRVHLLPAPSCSSGYIDRFRSITHLFWTNYLAITGELGGDMWAIAYRNVASATQLALQSREAFFRAADKCSTVTKKLPLVRLRKRSKEEERAGDEVTNYADADTVCRAIELRLGKVFHWAGWGALYNPNESQHANNPLFLFGEPMAIDDQLRMVTYEDEACEPVGLAESNCIDIIADDLKKTPVSECRVELTDDRCIKMLARIWRNMIVENIKNNVPREDIFWQAHDGQKGRRYLLEYNLGLLFLAAMLSSTQYTEEQVPICRYDLLTLCDITRLCMDYEQFPYLAADRWISQWFACFNTAAYCLFRRPYPPDLGTFARITSRLVIMLGIRERPRLPLCAMVHRHLRELGLPSEVHTVADSLITRLGHRVQECCAQCFPEGLHYRLPMSRYVRGEVFAMAIVVVVARLVFKLNDDFEYRWSKVARFLIDHEDTRTDLWRRINSDKLPAGPPPKTMPFEWTTWMCSRGSEMAASVTTTKVIKSKQRKARTPHCQSATPASAASSYVDLVRSVRTVNDFYGPKAAFDPQKDAGWGENLPGSRLYSSKAFKLSLTDPLSRLAENCPQNENASGVETRVEHNIVGDDSVPPGCSFCAQNDRFTIFQRPNENKKWVTFDCNALIGAHAVLESNDLKASSFLRSLNVPYGGIYKDWRHIIKHYTSYEPISPTTYAIKPVVKVSTSEFPEPIPKFLKEHETRLFNMGKASASMPADETPTAIGESLKSDNAHDASLRWFMETASSLCGARLTELLTEVHCVQYILELIPPDSIYPKAKEINLALAYHFDYRTTQ